MIISTDRHYEKNHIDVVEGMDPLLPLWTLPSYIDHPVRPMVNAEYGLADSGCP